MFSSASPREDTQMADGTRYQLKISVDGGYLFNGRWQFSSGTDACDWIFLGAMVGDANG